jgi:hypothetical protein
MRRTSLSAFASGLALALGLLTLAAPADASGVKPRIQGTAVDQQGNLLDDVQVEATAAGGVVASALTYANQNADGPQHGYFWLDVHRAGTYTVSLSKPGYTEVVLTGLEVGAAEVLSLGEVELAKKLIVPTRCSSGLKAATVGKAERGKVLVAIVSPTRAQPTGEVVATTDGRRVGRAALVKSDGGRLPLTLSQLAPGKHTFKTRYDGDPRFQGCKAGSVTLKVLSVKHADRRPAPRTLLPNVLW